MVSTTGQKDGLNLMSIDLDSSTHPLASPNLKENILNVKLREKTSEETAEKKSETLLVLQRSGGADE